MYGYVIQLEKIKKKKMLSSVVALKQIKIEAISDNFEVVRMNWRRRNVKRFPVWIQWVRFEYKQPTHRIQKYFCTMSKYWRLNIFLWIEFETLLVLPRVGLGWVELQHEILEFSSVNKRWKQESFTSQSFFREDDFLLFVSTIDTFNWLCGGVEWRLNV